MQIKGTRAFQAGVAMGAALVEMVQLMYQNQTAYRFLIGIEHILLMEIRRRDAAKEPQT